MTTDFKQAALDVRAARINDEMKITAVESLRHLAKKPAPAAVLQAYQVDRLEFSRDYILPKRVRHLPQPGSYHSIKR
ncbi:hypothetical protein [Pseudomonas sp.]|uniref:hypothetical protein n=1 Tax=Pseudomonas sp. TaxID=306 RepID=UPI003F2AE455